MTRPSSLRGAPGLLAALVLPALLACGASTRDEVLACALPTDCGPGARCVEGACQASTPPLADFTLPQGLTTHRPISVTATASDADPGDPLGFAWSVAAVTGGCAADVDAGGAITLEAVFWCPGTYEVTLVVTDGAGASSAPVRRTATVAALEGAPTVTAGPPVAVEHACAGAPLRCGLAGPVALSADGQAPLGGPLTYRWAALPPDGSRAGAAVAITPAPTARDANLALETDGGPISGAWRLRVRATDAMGNVAQAIQVVTVGNRAPVAAAAPVSLDHHYDGAYRVSGEVSVPVTDPDGDPLDVSLELEEPAASGCSAGLTAVTGTSGALALSCPAPGGLLAAGRRLVVTAADVNGAGLTAETPVVVRNRLPAVRVAGGLTELALHHAVGPCPGGVGACFLVTGANPFVAEDPDGDPLTEVTLVPGVAAGLPASFGQATPGAGGGTFTFGTPVASPAEFRADDGASGFWLTATASDPFGASAPAEPALPIRVLNRPPVLRTGATSISAAHRYDASLLAYVASAPLAAFEDPDGDPLLPAGSGGPECAAFTLDAGVLSVTCRRAFDWTTGAYPALAGFAGTHPITAAASDGWASAGLAVALDVQSETPTVPIYDGAVESCLCKCARYEPEMPTICSEQPTLVPDRSKAALPVHPADADGDPAFMTYALAPGSPAGATVTPAAVSRLPQFSVATVSSTTYPVTVDVTVTDGVRTSTGSWTIRQVTCSRTGEACELPPAVRR